MIGIIVDNPAHKKRVPLSFLLLGKAKDFISEKKKIETHNVEVIVK
jgi:hypothetical protein